MPSEKTPVIDYIWDMLQAEGTGRRLVLSGDIVRAINHCNSALGLGLSDRNPANFMKDIVRGDNANNHWPPRLTAIRIGARQRPGSQRVFEFVDFSSDQTEPFPNRYTARPSLVPITVESVSLPIAMRSLGRKDESWLIQVAVGLRLVQTHFAAQSQINVVEIAHLQTGVKLATSEIDALFLAHYLDEEEPKKALITCEAKQEGQRILEHQIAEQVVAGSRSVRQAGLDIDRVIPIAIKAIAPLGQVYIAEFRPWTHEMAEASEEAMQEIELASEGLYQLRPPVLGIGFARARPTGVRRRRRIGSPSDGRDDT